MSPRLRAVVFDLDDTLFDQRGWLDGAWEAVAAAVAERTGHDPSHTATVLRRIAAAGSADGGIIDRALAELALDVPVAPLVDVFRAHAPCRLPAYPGAREALVELGRHVPLGMVTDGDCTIQRSKIAALGLAELFSVIVLSDELGRAHRKPDPAPFRRALAGLGVEVGAVAFVGDNPAKDVVGAAALGLYTVRVRTGEYAAVESPVGPDAEVTDVVEAVAHLLPMVGA